MVFKLPRTMNRWHMALIWTGHMVGRCRKKLSLHGVACRGCDETAGYHLHGHVRAATSAHVGMLCAHSVCTSTCAHVCRHSAWTCTRCAVQGLIHRPTWMWASTVLAGPLPLDFSGIFPHFFFLFLLSPENALKII